MGTWSAKQAVKTGGHTGSGPSATAADHARQRTAVTSNCVIVSGSRTCRVPDFPVVTSPKTVGKMFPGEAFRVRSACWGLPGRLLGMVVVHDDVGVKGRVRVGEVEPLRGDVALAPSAFDVGPR